MQENVEDRQYALQLKKDIRELGIRVVGQGSSD